MEKVHNRSEIKHLQSPLFIPGVVAFGFLVVTALLLHLVYRPDYPRLLFAIVPVGLISIAVVYYFTKAYFSRWTSDEHLYSKELNQETLRLRREVDTLTKTLEQTREALIASKKPSSLEDLSIALATEIDAPLRSLMSAVCKVKEYVFFLDQLSKQQLDLLASLSKQEKLNHEEQLAEIETTLKIEDLDFVLSDANALIDDSLTIATQIKEITQGLKYYHPEEDEPVCSFVNDQIEQTVNLICNHMLADCALEKDLQACSMVKLTPRELNQVLHNLILNAAEAMDGTKKRLTLRSYQEGDNVFIEINDSGRGIKKEDLIRVFEPFFTTKKAAQGAGLGMSTSFDIVKRNGGDITVKSAPGKGAQVTIQLPASTHDSNTA